MIEVPNLTINRGQIIVKSSHNQNLHSSTYFSILGLHEDVQRVTSKPRITEEATSAHMAWRQYTSRESSAIVDKCVGQLKSSLTCDHCGYVSKVILNFLKP